MKSYGIPKARNSWEKLYLPKGISFLTVYDCQEFGNKSSKLGKKMKNGKFREIFHNSKTKRDIRKAFKSSARFNSKKEILKDIELYFDILNYKMIDRIHYQEEQIDLWDALNLYSNDDYDEDSWYERFDHEIQIDDLYDHGYEHHITNFKDEDLEIYQKAIDKFNKGDKGDNILYIGEGWGRYSKYGLYLTKVFPYKDLSEFWRIFDNLEKPKN